MANPLVVSLGIPLATLGVLLLVGASAGAQPAQPAPQSNTDVLKQKLDELMAQARANPLSVTPDALEQLAVSLDAAGLHVEAAQVRTEEAVVRQAQAQSQATGGGAGETGGTAPPSTPTAFPGLTPSQAARAANYLNPANHPQSFLVGVLATEVQLRNPAVAAQLRAREQVLRAAEILLAHGTGGRRPAGGTPTPAGGISG